MSVVINTAENGICTLQMNRPDKLNALNREMYAQLSAGINQASDEDSCRVIVLKGSAGVFSAGNDIGDFLASVAESGRFEAPMPFMEALLTCKKTIVASVDGDAIGIGATLLFHCDLVYGSNRARVHTPFATLGVCPEFGSSFTIPAMMGSHRAAQMLLLGDPLSATDGERVGLFNKIVEPDELDSVVSKVAARLASAPSDALDTSRRLLHANKSEMLELIQVEGEQFRRLMQTEEFKHNLQHFLNKGST